MSRFQGPFPLAKGHDVQAFECGKAPLDEFLKKHALQNQGNGSALTFVGLDGERVVGYYSLATSSVLPDDAPGRMTKGLARHPVPVILMARFAVDEAYQGQGVGSGLFKDAAKRVLGVSKEGAGVRALVVQAKDEEARAFYERFDMIRYADDSLHLYLLMKDVEQMVRNG